MATVYLALGSNVGDARGHISSAIELLGAELKDIRQAPIYRSKAVGYTDQPDFFNTALSGRTDLGPEELLDFLKETERRIGRTKTFRYGPREIDLDIIFYDDLELKTPGLTLPHPAFRGRDFVLKPLCDLAPHLTDPVSGHTVRQLLDNLSPRQESIIEKL